MLTFALFCVRHALDCARFAVEKPLVEGTLDVFTLDGALGQVGAEVWADAVQDSDLSGEGAEDDQVVTCRHHPSHVRSGTILPLVHSVLIICW